MNARIDITMIERIAAELSPYRDDEEAFWDTLDGETDVLSIVDRLLAAYENDGALIAGLKEHVQSIKARQDRISMRRDTIKKLIGSVLSASGEKKLERPLATVSVRPGQMSVSIDNENEVPSQLMREKITRAPDKAAIKAQIESGETVPGVSLKRGDDIVTVRVA